MYSELPRSSVSPLRRSEVANALLTFARKVSVISSDARIMQIVGTPLSQKAEALIHMGVIMVSIIAHGKDDE